MKTQNIDTHYVLKSLTDSPSSSADSYSSSSSTRKLLSAPLHDLQTSTVGGTTTTATIPTPSLAASRIIDIKVRDDKKISMEKAVDVWNVVLKIISKEKERNLQIHKRDINIIYIHTHTHSHASTFIHAIR